MTDVERGEKPKPELKQRRIETKLKIKVYSLFLSAAPWWPNTRIKAISGLRIQRQFYILIEVS